MKAGITVDGLLTITAENPNEEFALKMWWEQYTRADDLPKLISPAMRAVYDKETREAFAPYKPGEVK